MIKHVHSRIELQLIKSNFGKGKNGKEFDQTPKVS